MAKKREVQKQISGGVRKLVRQWERTGKIETSRATYRPKTKEEAIKQALAIEYGRARQEGKLPKRRSRPTGSGVFTDQEIARGYKIIWRP